MTQFNLLPDVKIEFLKAKQRMRIIVGVSVLAAAVSLVIFIALFSYVKFQSRHINALTTNIEGQVKVLKEIKDLDKILTVQNQLGSLPELHDNKQISSRLFDYLFLLTPNQATIAELQFDLTANTLLIKGNSDTFETVNKFADTLKFTEYTINTDPASSGRAFNNVVLQKFSVNNSENRKSAPVEYELLTSFDPKIFSNIKDAVKDKPAIEIKAPNIISSRSAIEAPGSLFAPQDKNESAVPPPNSSQSGGQ